MADRNEREKLIDSAVRAIADGSPPPWEELDRARADPARLDALRTLEAIASAFRAGTTTAAADRPVLFRWGALDVEAPIGTGSFGEVYRAFDPWLGRHVALKLFRDSGNAAGLDEARRLARLRHRNVLSVYGCGVHDGRAGLWSELIEGRTLASAVAAEGAFSSAEALRVGLDLAKALTVVHAAALVHGDVKAENVMRESGGRIVLMDFGAGGDARLLAGQRLISGTPRYLPPEVLDGAPIAKGTDIYAFGVLMFLLLSGRYPFTATDAARLRDEQRRGERPALRTLHPELDPALCALVENCLANDPDRRPASAAELCERLTDCMRRAAPGTRRRWWPIAASIALAAALGTVALWPRLTPPPWDSAAQFLRVEPSGDVAISPDSALHVGDRLRLSLRSSRDVYVYVLNEDADGNAAVLYPLGAETASNRQPAGTAMLPGGAGSTLAWKVSAGSPREEFVVVASLVPQADIENELASWARAQEADTRAVGSLVNVPRLQLRGEHLQRVLAALDHDREQVRVWQFSFAHAP